MQKITITYIGGGSRGWAHKYFSDLLTQAKLCGELRLYDIDLPAARRNEKYFNKLKRDSAAAVKSEWQCRVVPQLDAALQGADFVVISILPFSLKNMVVDVHHPRQMGIWQPVGDTVGPGGYSRMLRTVTAYRLFAQKIRENCPTAWVINYTNPMAMCVNALYREFPEIKAFGCCHEVFGTQGLLARIAGLYLALCENGKQQFMAGSLPAVLAELDALGLDFFKDKSGIRREEIRVNVQGTNHFTWLSSAHYGDLDLFPIYAAYIKLWRQYHAENGLRGYQRKEGVKYELFEACAAIAAAGDRHLSEFIPATYLRSRKTKQWGFGLTSVHGRIWGARLLKAKLLLNNSPLVKATFRPSGEEGVRQITALCGLADLTTNVNLPNHGQIPNLPQGTAVETNAVFTKDSVVPVQAGEMSEKTAALTLPHVQCQRDFVAACFAEDAAALKEVFCNDPAVKRLTKAQGEQLFDEMVRKNRDVIELRV